MYNIQTNYYFQINSGNVLLLSITYQGHLLFNHQLNVHFTNFVDFLLFFNIILSTLFQLVYYTLTTNETLLYI